MGKKKRVTEKKDDEEIEDVEDEDLDDSGEDFDDLDMPDEQENDESSADENIFDERSAIAKQFQVEEKEDITEERTYTVPLSRAYLRPPKKRAKRAINLIKKFFKRHMKPEELIILPEVNQEIWSRGIEKPPRKIKIRATKSIEGTVTLYIA
ncbi:MAG: 50S ribosomal protein L31e [Promethearchaeota archaeon]